MKNEEILTAILKSKRRRGGLAAYSMEDIYAAIALTREDCAKAVLEHGCGAHPCFHPGCAAVRAAAAALLERGK